MPKLILASTSPRRKELLQSQGYAFEVQTRPTGEIVMPGEAPEQYVRRVALDKARAVRDALGAPPDTFVLGADTEVVLDDRVLGKPFDRAHACLILAALSGRIHQVLSAVALVGPGGERCELQTSRVRFKALSIAEIQDYVNTGDAADKAGAYGIQGRAAAFIEHLEGSFSGVMGLPMYETTQLLALISIYPDWMRR